MLRGKGGVGGNRRKKRYQGRSKGRKKMRKLLGGGAWTKMNSLKEKKKKNHGPKH